MKLCPLILMISSVTWGDLTVPNDVLDFKEKDVPGMKHRQARDLTPEDTKQVVGTFSTRPIYKYNTKPLPKYDFWTFGSPDALSAYEKFFDDPYWKFQWYQHDCRVTAGPVLDHNIVPVQRMGFDGKGITIGVLGEGLSHKLYDMQFRVLEIYNAMEGQLEKTSPVLSNMATRVAGVIAMNANNSECGAGIAYNAKVTAPSVWNTLREEFLCIPTFFRSKHSITVMDGDIYNDDHFIAGINYKLKDLDIYIDAVKRSHDGMTMPFSKKIKNALADIATKGRNNKGGIYVVGAGNGGGNEDSGGNGDNCGADYIANSIYTFVIGSATKLGYNARYSEQCSAIIATAYSSEELDDDQCTGLRGIVTIEGRKACTRDFGGTAASAAIASGIFALTLQANPGLSLRDLMHIIAMSSERAPLYKNGDWTMNGAGFYVSHKFGFGLLNAENMVLISQKWESVPKMITCKLTSKNIDKIENGKIYSPTFKVDRCPSMDDPKNSVKYIEQVELVTTISCKKRGSIHILLTSPKGTLSYLIYQRKKDTSKKGFNQWRSLHFWGEEPIGKWKLAIYDTLPTSEEANRDWNDAGCISNLVIMLSHNVEKVKRKVQSTFSFGDQIRAELLIHGTSDMPKHYDKTPPNQRRTYSYAPNSPMGEWL